MAEKKVPKIHKILGVFSIKKIQQVAKNSPKKHMVH